MTGIITPLLRVKEALEETPEVTDKDLSKQLHVPMDMVAMYRYWIRHDCNHKEFISMQHVLGLRYDDRTIVSATKPWLNGKQEKRWWVGYVTDTDSTVKKMPYGDFMLGHTAED